MGMSTAVGMASMPTMTARHCANGLATSRQARQTSRPATCADGRSSWGGGAGQPVGAALERLRKLGADCGAQCYAVNHHVQCILRCKRSFSPRATRPPRRCGRGSRPRQSPAGAIRRQAAVSDM